MEHFKSELHIPPEIIPQGINYKYLRYSVTSELAHDCLDLWNIASHFCNGWRFVPSTRHPELMTQAKRIYSVSPLIQYKGLVLCEKEEEVPKVGDYERYSIIKEIWVDHGSILEGDLEERWELEMSSKIKGFRYLSHAIEFYFNYKKIPKNLPTLPRISIFLSIYDNERHQTIDIENWQRHAQLHDKELIHPVRNMQEVKGKL